MTIVVDTSLVFALWASRDKNHAAAVEWYETVDDDLVTTPLAAAEMDHLVRRTRAEGADRIVIANLASRALQVDWWEDAVRTCRKIADLRPDVGLVDASLVALAGHRKTTRIATFDERRFRTLAPLTGEPSFTLLPADAD